MILPDLSCPPAFLLKVTTMQRWRYTFSRTFSWIAVLAVLLPLTSPHAAAAPLNRPQTSTDEAVASTSPSLTGRQLSTALGVVAGPRLPPGTLQAVAPAASTPSSAPANSEADLALPATVWMSATKSWEERSQGDVALRIPS